MNHLQKVLLKGARKNGDVLPAPCYQMSLEECEARCGLHNLGLCNIKQDWSVTLTLSGKEYANSLIEGESI